MSVFNRQNLFRIFAACLALFILYLLFISASASKHINVLITTPSNSSFKFHVIDGYSTSLIVTPIEADWASGSHPSHILVHPLLEDTFLVTNEVLKGEVWAVKLNRKEKVIEKLHSASTSGADPCWCSTIHQHLICTNYAGGNVVLFRVSPDSITPQFEYTIARDSEDSKSHPHQVILHPQLADIFYVPDLGLNKIHVFRLAGRGTSARLESVQEFNTTALGLGPRHGAVSSDGDNLFLDFQTSSSAVRISLNVDGTILYPNSTSFSTLTPSHQRLDPVYTQLNFALSDLRLSPREQTLYVLNRRVGGQFETATGDTLAVFSDIQGEADMTPPKHVSLGCWQPREMVFLDDDESLKSSSTSRALVSCLGKGGKGAGLVLLTMKEESVKVDSLPFTLSSMGIVVI